MYWTTPMVYKLNKNAIIQKCIIAILVVLIIYITILYVNTKQNTIIVSVNEFTATIIKNNNGNEIVASVSDMPFSKVVINITDHTFIGTMNGTFIAVYPEMINGDILVKFNSIDYIKDNIAYLKADEILVSTD